MTAYVEYKAGEEPMKEGVEYWPGTGFARYWLDPIGILQKRYWLWRSKRALDKVHKLRKQGTLVYVRDHIPHWRENTECLLTRSGAESVEQALHDLEAQIDADIVRKTGKTRAQLDEELEAGRKEYLQGRTLEQVFGHCEDKRGTHMCTLMYGGLAGG